MMVIHCGVSLTKVVLFLYLSTVGLDCIHSNPNYYKYSGISCLTYDVTSGLPIPTVDQCKEICDMNEDCMGFQFRPWNNTKNCLLRRHCEKQKEFKEGWTVYRRYKEIYLSYANATCSSESPPVSGLTVSTEGQCRDTCEMLSSCMAYEYRDRRLGYNCLPLYQCDVLSINMQGWDTYWSDKPIATEHSREVCCESHGPFGGTGGRVFNDWKVAKAADGPITQIHLMEGQYIQSLSFTYGTDKTKDHGILVESYGTRGLQEGEKIIGVYGNHGGFLDKLGFITNFRQLGPFGYGGGTAFNVSSNGRSLKYISGKAGEILDQVTFFFCCENKYLWPESVE